MTEAKEKNYFEKLNDINVSDRIEKKNNLSYLSWAWAWAELKKRYPNAQNKVYETAQGCFYWTDGKTCWVKVSVTIEGIEHIEYLPVLDFKNRSILLENITSFNVNSSIQRALTKAIARHGLGLYIYAGEDLPEEEEVKQPSTKQTPYSGVKKRTKAEITKDLERLNKLIEEAQSPDDLSEIWKKDKAFIDELRAFDEQYYMNLVDDFKGKKEILETDSPLEF